MPQEEWEFRARDAFITFLGSQEGVTVKPGRSEVIVDSLSKRNFDFELLSNDGTPEIALEIVRLTHDEASLRAHSGWEQICPLIQQELESLGYESLFALVPQLSFQQAALSTFAKEQARMIHHMVQASPHSEEEIRSQGYTIYRRRKHEGVYVTGAPEGGFIDGPKIVKAQLEPLLPKKTVN